MKLKYLMNGLEYVCAQGSDDVEINQIAYDSRKACTGGVFICIDGADYDGHLFAEEACTKGAAAVIVTRNVDLPNNVTVLRLKNTRQALAIMSANYFGTPARQLKTIAVTGTKGKTTTTYMVKKILEEAGKRVGLIGTIETIIGDKIVEATNTTPESFEIQRCLQEMVEAGMDCMVMEVSSQALMQDRVFGITFDYGIFTNIEKDHIGDKEHKDFADYGYWKSRLFRQCRVGIANCDDSHFKLIMRDATCIIETFGMSKKADLRATDMRLFQSGNILGVEYLVSGLLDMNVRVNVPGKFSLYNSLAAIAVSRHLGAKEEHIKKAMEDIRVKGRVELVHVNKKSSATANADECTNPQNFSVMIDYAHNAMALESLLKSLREYNPKRLVCLFGCGGNRDRNRRFEMGEISSRLADFTIITSDNPRHEEPSRIIKDILVGVAKASGDYIVIPDRGEAITYAIKNACDGDMIIIAGKGHENYQIAGDTKSHFDDREIIESISSTHASDGIS